MGNDRTMNEQTIIRPKELTQNIEEATYDFSKMGKQPSYEKTLKSITLLRTKSIKKDKIEEAKDKYIRAKKALIQEKAAANKKLQTEFHEEFDRKKKLKKAAKEVLLIERARDKAIEKANAKELGLVDPT